MRLPINWPMGNGPDFRGVYDRQSREAHLFQRTPQGAYRAPQQVGRVDYPLVRDAMAPDVYASFRDEIDLLEGAGAEFDLNQIRAGRLTPSSSAAP